jgi:quinol monooxygenase YgiN
MFKPFIITISLILFASLAKAQNNKPYVRIAKIVVDSAQLESYKSELKTGMETAVKLEPGVLSMYAVYDKQFPTHITILETYASKEAYQSHIQTSHFKKYKSGTLSMVKSLELTDVTPIAYEVKKKKQHFP